MGNLIRLALQSLFAACLFKELLKNKSKNGNAKKVIIIAIPLRLR